MKRSILAASLVVLGAASSAATPAYAHHGQGGNGFWLGLGLGSACCGYYPYYAPYYYRPYYYEYPDYYYAPPPVIYAEPPPVTYIAPPPASSYYYYPPPPAAAASQASPVFVDEQGRTCRTFKTSVNGTAVSGTACLQPDGTWRTVGE